ncbi:MAG TPA: serine hydrolase domain-containing protein [Candidatus Limnocylindria bacterium]|nr:serine hydrolase domain-containing protein [Candidatus Limnocylindria bacterium]
MSAEAAKPAVDAAIGTLCTACSLQVERRGARTAYRAGTRCPDPAAGSDAPVDDATLFDLASLTKLATTSLALLLVRERVLTLDTPLRELVPDFRGAGKERVTLAHVLTHTAGLKWWLPLYEEVRSAEEAAWRAASEPLAHDLGTFVYSDLGYIMLTVGLERAGGAPFREQIRERILREAGAETADFLPTDPLACVATEVDAKWRGRRLRGEVHDENAAAMGGVSGHAGLFGTAADVAALVRVFRDGAVIGDDLAALARREHARGENARRGLGLALRAPDGPMVGRHFSVDSYGHTGFTGTSVWVDPAAGLTVVLLTNRVYFGRANDEATYAFRIDVHEAVSAP